MSRETDITIVRNSLSGPVDFNPVALEAFNRIVADTGRLIDPVDVAKTVAQIEQDYHTLHASALDILKTIIMADGTLRKDPGRKLKQMPEQAIYMASKLAKLAKEEVLNNGN